METKTQSDKDVKPNQPDKGRDETVTAQEARDPNLSILGLTKQLRERVQQLQGSGHGSHAGTGILSHLDAIDQLSAGLPSPAGTIAGEDPHRPGVPLDGGDVNAHDPANRPDKFAPPAPEGPRSSVETRQPQSEEERLRVQGKGPDGKPLSAAGAAKKD